jgi:photosystem II stability/assembly factor-like uncharacterized protein
MTDSDFDGSVRATLADVALQTPVPDGLNERLIANAEAGRTVVTPLHSSRRRVGWTLPLLAAAAVVVVAGGALAVSHLADQGNQPKPPAGSATHIPTAPPRPVDPVPDFRVATVSFRDPQHGVALGVGNCGGPAAASCKVTLIATDDGGASWHVLGVPPGLRSMLNPDDPSCGTNGGVLGPCVDRVLFADSADGYLFGLHEFYSTSDGGQTWHHAPAPPADSSGVPTINNVPTMVAAQGYAYRMFAAHESSAGGAGRLQRAPIGTNDWTDISPADAGIYTSFLAASGPALYLEAGIYAGHENAQLYRSTDHGDHWQQVGPKNASLANSLSNLLVAPDGAVALTTIHCTTYVAADGISFSEHNLPGGCHRTGAYVAGIASGTELTVVAHPGPGNDRHLQLYHSSDGGASYQPVASNDPPGSQLTTAIQMNGDFGYVATSPYRVDVTFDGGRTWQARSF